MSENGQMIMNVIDLLPWIPLPVFFVIARKNMFCRTFLCSPMFFVWVGCIVFFFSLSAVLNNSEGVSFVSSLMAMIRFMPIPFFLNILIKNETDFKQLDKTFLILFVTLLSIAYAELIFGIPVSEAVAPFSGAKYLNRERYFDMAAIFPNSVDLGYSLWVLFMWFLFIKKIRFLYIFFAIYLIIQYFIGSKVILIISLLCILVYLFRYRRNSCYGLFILVFCSCTLLLFFMFDLFYYTVFIDARQTRVGIILDFLPQFIMTPYVWLGAGPDPARILSITQHFDMVMMDWGEEPMFLALVLGDTYIVGLIVYIGIFGFSYVFLFFIKIYFDLRSKMKKYFPAGLPLIFSLFSGLFLGSFGNQVLCIRPAMLLFWSILGMLSLSIRFSIEKKVINI